MEIKTEKKVYTEPISEEIKNMLEAKVKRFRDAQRWVKPDRTPFMAHLITWQFLDAGYTLAESSRDYDIKRDAMIYAETHYKFDHINCIGSGFRNVFKVTDSLCGTGDTNTERITGEANTKSVQSDGASGVMTAIFEGFIKPEDYPAIKENYTRALWEKALFRRYPAAKNYTPEQFAMAAATMWEYLGARQQLDSELRFAYGDPMETVIAYYGNMFEELFNTLSGIKGLGIAMRRNHDELLDLCTTADIQRFEAFKGQAGALPDCETTECYDYIGSLLSQNIMTKKQFEEFLLPGQKLFLDFTKDMGKLAYYWSEGTILPCADFYNDYPKGVVTMMIETDDPYMIREKYPNIAIQGGLFNGHLGNGTPEQNIEDAKKAIDTLGRDGGLVLASNKMVTYECDLKRENLIAIGEFLESYKG